MAARRESRDTPSVVEKALTRRRLPIVQVNDRPTKLTREDVEEPKRHSREGGRLPTLASKIKGVEPHGDLKESKTLYRDFAHQTATEHGRPDLYLGAGPKYWGQPDSNAKAAGSPVPIWTMTLSPSTSSGLVDNCSCSTPACEESCLVHTAGQTQMPESLLSAKIKTNFAALHPAQFKDINLAERQAIYNHRGRWESDRAGMRWGVGDDNPWEEIFPEAFTPDVLWTPRKGKGLSDYAYSKLPILQRIAAMEKRGQPLHTMHLTQSAHEQIHKSYPQIEKVMEAGYGVAVPVNVHPRRWVSDRVSRSLSRHPSDPIFDDFSSEMPRRMPRPLSGHMAPMEDGDYARGDFRPADPRGGRWVGLRGKGTGHDDFHRLLTSGFGYDVRTGRSYAETLGKSYNRRTRRWE